MLSFSTALDGLSRAQQMVDQSVTAIARMPVGLQAPGSGSQLAADTVDLSPAMVGLIEAQNAYEVSLTALDSIIEVNDHLLDVLG